MNQEKMVLLLIKGQISNLTDAQQIKVKVLADKLRSLYKESDRDEPGIGTIAMALVSAELAAEE